MIELPDDIRLVFRDRPEFLHVSVSGPRDSHEISLAYWARIAAECERRRARKVLVEEHLGDFEGERNMQGIVDAGIALGLDKVRIAFVIGRIELLAHMEHGEILAMEQGADGRVFANVASAEHWLRHGSGG